ncbi:hypothetical protein [Alteraurantiacibacter palmitatis]|uniref:Uncharacterized protein n=1 Tax=Alteraurantiacibacter palmitatis TaxID=2054628 RepID=A0ABV7EAD8_9SPHN
MNWGFDGKPNSWAPPRVGLAIIPVLGTLVLLALAVLLAWLTPPEERAAALPVILLGGLGLLAVHAGHLHFALRQRDD